VKRRKLFILRDESVLCIIATVDNTIECIDNVFRVVEHLLRHGADPALRDHGGYTATHYAALSGHRLPLEMVCTPPEYIILHSTVWMKLS